MIEHAQRVVAFIQQRKFSYILCAAAFAGIGAGFLLPTEASTPRKVDVASVHTTPPPQPEPIPSVVPTPPPAAPAPPPPPPPPPPPKNPLLGLQLYVDPYSNARAQATAWRTSRPQDAVQMDKVAAVPTAIWLGEWHQDIRHATQKVMQAAAGKTPILVVYSIPQRDCGSYSSGGAASPEAYRAWIRNVAAGIGSQPAIVILEPDGTALTRCLNPQGVQTRFELFRYAVKTLKAQPGTKVYIDAGNAHWLSVPDIAGRLQQAGIASADGFALNVSNFATTQANTDYGNKVSAIVRKGFVIDTSRNGRGPTPDHQWCNPPDRALGERSRIVTNQTWLHAYLWIKIPGQSDGSCNGAPAAGVWWPEYALGLAQRAAY